MLPFLKAKPAAQTGVIIQQRPSDSPDSDKNSGIEACAQDLISAIHAKDVKGVAAALQAAMELGSGSDMADESESEGDII